MKQICKKEFVDKTPNWDSDRLLRLILYPENGYL
jgi:hypothetical protein